MVSRVSCNAKGILSDIESSAKGGSEWLVMNWCSCNMPSVERIQGDKLLSPAALPAAISLFIGQLANIESKGKLILKARLCPTIRFDSLSEHTVSRV